MNYQLNNQEYGFDIDKNEQQKLMDDSEERLIECLTEQSWKSEDFESNHHQFS